MNIPFNSLKEQVADERAAIEAAVARVLDSGWFLMGPELTAFEAAFAAFVGVAQAVAVANGTEAISLALRALSLAPGDEVVVPALTAPPCYHAILAAGCVPVFAEVDPRTYTLDPAAVDKVCGPRTRAVLAVHLYGRMCDLDGLAQVCREKNLLLVEDCAQAHGATDARGRTAGSVGAAAAFSFYPTKNLGALGDGGAVLTNAPEVAARLRRLRQYGEGPRYVCREPGANSRMDEIQAAVLRMRLTRLPELNARRRLLAARYAAGLAGLPLVLPPVPEEAPGHVHHLFVVRTPRRDDLAAFLKERGIGSAVHYPVPGHAQPMFTGGLAPYRAGALTATEGICAELLSLPLYPSLTEAQMDEVTAAVRAFFAS
jgi:dTDP-4-amino-4,6-dideoxygalactose transaminase